MNTKLHAVADAQGRPIRLFVTAGPVSGYTGAAAMLSSLPQAEWMLADRGYDADWFRDALKDKGIKACIPGRKGRKKAIVLTPDTVSGELQIEVRGDLAGILTISLERKNPAFWRAVRNLFWLRGRTSRNSCLCIMSPAVPSGTCGLAFCPRLADQFFNSFSTVIPVHASASRTTSAAARASSPASWCSKTRFGRSFRWARPWPPLPRNSGQA